MDREELRRLWRDHDLEKPAPAAPAPDTLFGFPRVAAAADLWGARLAVLGVPLGGWGEAPAAVRRSSITMAAWPALTAGVTAVDYGDVPVDQGNVEASFVRAHERLADIVAAGALPVVLGGDAVVTVPTVQVLAGKLRGRLGIVAVAPRLDLALEPPYVAGSRWARVLELGVAEGGTFAVVGGHPAAVPGAERTLLEALGARWWPTTAVDELGIAAVADEVLEWVARGTEAVYLSVDLEATAACDGAGLTPREALALVRAVGSVNLAGVDVCGVRPTQGPAGDSAALAARVCAELLTAVGGEA